MSNKVVYCLVGSVPTHPCRRDTAGNMEALSIRYFTFLLCGIHMSKKCIIFARDCVCGLTVPTIVCHNIHATIIKSIQRETQILVYGLPYRAMGCIMLIWYVCLCTVILNRSAHICYRHQDAGQTAISRGAVIGIFL